VAQRPTLSAMALPLAGALQRGLFIPNGDPTRAAWREIRRFGTVENLRKVALERGHSEDVAESAATRIEQALDLQESCHGLSILTRPIPQYYAALNLVRGVLLTGFGDMGKTTHGAAFIPSASLLDSKVRVCKSGTLRKFVDHLYAGSDPSPPPAPLEDEAWTLRELLRSLPHVSRFSFPLGDGPPPIARVRVDVFQTGLVDLVYDIHGLDANHFREHWKELLPWWKDNCEHHEVNEFTLQTSLDVNDLQSIERLCRPLYGNMNRTDQPIFFDDVHYPGATRLPRMEVRYLAALFVLSNISRYEPELLAEPARRSTNVRLVIEAFLDDAAIRVPQLMLRLLEGQLYLFQ
jgi:hypothetical protein